MNYIGHIDEVTRYYVAGWAANQDDWAASLKIDILVNGIGTAVCVADRFRKGLAELHPDATGRYGFKFYFASPLSMFKDQEVAVRVSGTAHYLIRQTPVIPAVMDDDHGSAQRPHGPVLLATMGRTGSTVIMSALKQHPNIVVAGRQPYEVELGCYYAHALRTLVAAGDHERSLRTDDITAVSNRFHIGFNPYFESSFAGVFSDPRVLGRFMTKSLPTRLARTFRGIILDYYEELAKDRGIQHPIYFAEKSLPEPDSRLGIRFMFPNLREIVLVRDLRDVVCSATSSNGLDFEHVLESTVVAAKQVLSIAADKLPNKIIIKYEDFILDREGTMARLFAFLGLTSVKPDEDSMSGLFASHGTSATPTASIGRWKRDLNLEQQRQFKVFDQFLEEFGYPSSEVVAM